MYLLVLILFTNEKWINLSHLFMLDLLVKVRYGRKFKTETSFLEREEEVRRRSEELERLQQEVERREVVERWARAVSPLNDCERRTELLASK